MKKSVNIKYFLLIIFFVLNSFSVSTSIRDVNYGAINTEESLNKDVPLVFYPEETTLKVNQKLDSLFNRFNKRHDFHGSVIVAKKGKVIFKNHYGYADFKQKSLIDDNSHIALIAPSRIIDSCFSGFDANVAKDKAILRLFNNLDIPSLLLILLCDGRFPAKPGAIPGECGPP